jgi:hypothetical protein
MTKSFTRILHGGKDLIMGMCYFHLKKEGIPVLEAGMNIIWFQSRLGRMVSSFIAVMLALGLIMALPVSAVHAQDAGGPSNAPIQADKGYPFLEKAFQKIQAALGDLENAIQKAADGDEKVLGLINMGKTAGLDTSDLSSAQADYQASLANVQTMVDNAKTSMETHAGFDAQGRVTDPTDAKNTLREVVDAIKDARGELKNCVETLRSAVSAWLERLSEELQNAKDWLSTQEGNINKLKDATSALAIAIDQARRKGLDTSSLEGVFADLQSQLPQSQSSHAAAEGILASHQGFDDSGQVTDIMTARKTLVSARTELEASRSINISLAQELKETLESWKSSHPKETLGVDVGKISE